MSLVYRALMYAGSWVCHQLPERSPHLFGVQLPLCWRFTGILFGALALLCWVVIRKRVPPLPPARPLPPALAPAPPRRVLQRHHARRRRQRPPPRDRPSLGLLRDGRGAATAPPPLRPPRAVEAAAHVS